MNLRHTLLTTACAVALVASSGAYAADKTGAGVQQNTSASVAANTSAMSDVKADELIGKSVTNYQDESVGDVESVIIGSSGKVQAVVVGVGGFLGMGERNVALDWNSLDISKNGEQIRVGATVDQLKAMPAYTYRDEAWRGKAYQDNTYRQTASADRVEKTDRDLNESVAVTTLMDGRGNVKASELIGMDVVNSAGETIGDIEEILISDGGKIDAIIGAGGFLGMGETRLLVAWSSLSLHKEADQVQVRTSMSADDLRKLPYDDK